MAQKEPNNGVTASNISVRWMNLLSLFDFRGTRQFVFPRIIDTTVDTRARIMYFPTPKHWNLCDLYSRYIFTL